MLNIKDMNSWRALNLSIKNAAWNQLIHMLIYKAESADKLIVFVDPTNTTKECSNCGRMVAKDLSERMHRCDACGLEIDRDLNAAINIYNRGSNSLGRVGLCSLNHQEASAFHAGE